MGIMSITPCAFIMFMYYFYIRLNLDIIYYIGSVQYKQNMQVKFGYVYNHMYV